MAVAVVMMVVVAVALTTLVAIAPTCVVVVFCAFAVPKLVPCNSQVFREVEEQIEGGRRPSRDGLLWIERSCSEAGMSFDMVT